jgi:hypothetical protein
MEYDYDKLIGKIAEKFRTRGRFAVAMGMSERTLSLKMNNIIDFKQDEIIKACEVLEIKHSDIPIYFFTQVVQSA